ncbi:MAG TPA: hypothetical protein VJJ78_01865 [Candidatus Saccharimonadales bacterium]|nr:hypothetical protein [Candidatus Saccharimonadales bacterium]
MSNPYENITPELLERISAVGDALEHGHFNLVLTGNSNERFEKELRVIFDNKRAVGVGEFIIQFFLEGQDEQREGQPLWWMALPYDFAVTEEGIDFHCKEQILTDPGHRVEIGKVRSLAEIPIITIGWPDIKKEFEHTTYNPHPRLEEMHPDDQPPA